MSGNTSRSRLWFELLFGCVAAAIVAISTSADTPESPARFFALGDLAGGETISFSYGLSGSGDVIAGESFSAISQTHGEGVQWARVSETTWNMTGMGLPATAQNSPAAGVSRDGDWIVGRASFAPGSQIDTEAYRWRPSTGFELLGLASEFRLAAALGADKHGDLIVGFGGPNPSYNGVRALAWKRTGSRRTSSTWQIETIEAEYNSMATRVDPRGKLAIGWAGSWVPGLPCDEGRQAAYWRRGTGGAWQRYWLGALPTTEFHSQAAAIARNGSNHVIVGFSGDFCDVQLPVIWTITSADLVEMAELPLLSGYSSGSANAMSKNGSRIVGNCWDADFNFRACVWDWDATSSSYVASDLQERLSALGVTEADGWTLWTVSGVSGDGVVICGSGTNPFGDTEAWAADLECDSDRRDDDSEGGGDDDDDSDD